MTTFVHAMNGEWVCLSAIRSVTEVEGQDGRPATVVAQTVDGRKVRLGFGFDARLLDFAGTPVAAAPGFAVIWWGPAEGPFPEGIAEYPVIAWLIDALGNQRPITPDQDVNRAYAIEGGCSDYVGLRHPDGRVFAVGNAPPMERTYPDQDAFVDHCRKSDAAYPHTARAAG